MNKLYGLIVGHTVAVAAPFASASADSVRLHPSIGGAEVTYDEMGDAARGINASDSSNEFWYAGTSGWSSE